MAKPITLVTSIAPFMKRSSGTDDQIGEVYQYSCVESWKKAGFKVLSVNPPDEIKKLREVYPNVEFTPARRDARKEYGKPLVPIAELIHALEGTDGEIGGIINADIFLVDNPELMALVREHTRDGLSYLKREEVTELTAKRGYTYHFGLDAFFFDIKNAAKINVEPFALGVPWWDYMFPMGFFMDGLPLTRIALPVARHLTHAINWKQEQWRNMYAILRERYELSVYEKLVSHPELTQDPVMMYALCQGSFYARYYSHDNRCFDLNLGGFSDEDCERHMSAFAYYILETMESNSRVVVGSPYEMDRDRRLTAVGAA